MTHSAKTDQKAFILRYLLNPVELIGKDHIEGVKLEKMRLEGPAGNQRPLSCEPKKYTQIECDLVVKSIGYKSKPIKGIPFDPKTSTVPHI